MKASIFTSMLFVVSVSCVSAAGIVAETHSGKTVVFEWFTHGTVVPPVFESATLKIVDRAGSILYEEDFQRKDLVEYDEKDHDGDRYEVRLLIRGEEASFDLQFDGTNRDTVAADGKREIDVLIEILRRKGRAIEPGSSLIVNTPIGRFTFEDVICGIYGDV